MLKKTITYKDLDGNEISEDFYFNLNAAEIAEMELSQEGGLGAYIETIVQSSDGSKLIKAFKDILTASIGRRSEDGKRFVKSEEIAKEFMETDAYSEFFLELVTNANAAADFINGVVPQDLIERAGKILENVETVKGTELENKTPAYILEDREPTSQELAAMSPDELRDAFKRRQERRNQAE